MCCTFNDGGVLLLISYNLSALGLDSASEITWATRPPYCSLISILEYRVIHDTKSFLPIHHPQTTRLLGITRMPDHTALLHPGRRRDDEPHHLFARSRPQAVERGVACLCYTLFAFDGKNIP